MAIMLILIGLLIVGLRQWGDKANRQTTILRLELLNGALSDLQAVGGRQFSNQWFMNYVNPNLPNVTAPLPLDLSLYGDMNPDKQPTYPMKNPDLLVLNQINTTIGYNNRLQAIDDTSYGIMSKFVALPSTNKAIQGLPASVLTNFMPVNPGQAPLYPTKPILPYTPMTSGGPVVLDAWGNPIIFVPASGAMNVYVNLIYTNSTNGYTGTKLDGSTPQLTITAPDGRPFWVSAGPDGDFVKGDDNIYSFNPQ
jgi:type II secretory pathway pseudopilin PulG